MMPPGRQAQGPGGFSHKRVFYLSVQALVNAVIIGFIAKALVFLIEWITGIAFYGKASPVQNPGGHHLGYWVIAIPVLGGLIVGIIARFGSRAIRGHGIPEAMEKIILEDSRIPWPITFLKPLSAAISIGTGGPFGAEGPIIATGGAFGSVIGQVAHISSEERKVLLAAGACAGMAAIFGSPLAAVLLAIELLLFEFSPRSIIPVGLACAGGAAMHFWLFGSLPVFAMPYIPVPTASALGAYTLAGLVIGLVATGITWAVYAVEDLFEHLPIHWMWWPALGGIAVGVVGIFAPYTMGVGYDNIRHLLEGNLPLTLLVGLSLLKFISWVISLGSGTSGGTLAPLFTIGGALGSLLGLVLVRLFPNAGINAETCALIGMAALFAGASRALLTAIVFSLETTGQMHGLLPLLAACTTAYFVSFFFMKGSIMTEKILRRGVVTPESYEPDALLGVTVAQLYTPAGEGEGVVPGPAVSDPSAQRVCLSDYASTAARVMGQTGASTLEVLQGPDEEQVIGTISAASLLQYYARQKIKGYVYHSPMATRKWMVRGRRLGRATKRNR